LGLTGDRLSTGPHRIEKPKLKVMGMMGKEELLHLCLIRLDRGSLPVWRLSYYSFSDFPNPTADEIENPSTSFG